MKSGRGLSIRRSDRVVFSISVRAVSSFLPTTTTTSHESFMRRWRSIIKSAAAQHRSRLPIFLSLNLSISRCPAYGDSVGSRPVCGADGRDYANVCELNKSSCHANRSVDVKFQGVCGMRRFFSFLFRPAVSFFFFRRCCREVSPIILKVALGLCPSNV